MSTIFGIIFLLLLSFLRVTYFSPRRGFPIIIRIPLKKNIPPHYAIFGQTKGDFGDTCAEKIPLGLMGGRAESQLCADPGAMTPIGASIIFILASEIK